MRHPLSIVAAALAAALVSTPATAQPSSDAAPALVQAARRGDVARVAELAKRGPALNAVDPSGQTALSWAVHNLNVPLTELLLKRSADPNLANIYGVTPLMIAAKAGNSDLVGALLAAGADPNRVNWAGETALLVAVPVKTPVLGAGFSGVPNPDPPTDVSEAARAKADEAAQVRALTVVEALLKAGAKVDVRETRYGQTALMIAAASDNTELVKLLLRSGADPNVATPTLDVVLPESRESSLKRTVGGFTPLMFAASRATASTVKVLLDAGVDPNVQSAEGYTPLLLSLYRHAPIFHTWPLDYAIHGDVEMAEMLLAKGANPNLANRFGLTPLAAAVFNAYGAEMRGQALDETMAQFPNDAKGEAAVRLLLRHGADPNVPIIDYTVIGPAGQDLRWTARYHNVTPFLLASALNKPALVDLMLKTGRVDLGASRTDGDTRLMGAVQLNSLLGVKALVEAGADVNAVNSNGKTALHFAATATPGAGAIASYLIAKGARPDVRDKSGHTPYDLAKAAAPASRTVTGSRLAAPGDAAEITLKGLAAAEGPSGRDVLLGNASAAASAKAPAARASRAAGK